MTIDDEIRAAYAAMGNDLACQDSPILGGGFVSLSQYGYEMETGFASLAEAVEYSLTYYRTRMNLIRQ